LTPLGQAVVVSAASSVRPILDAARRYWFVLAPPDLVNDSFFWWRHADQPDATIAYRIGASGALVVGYGRIESFPLFGGSVETLLAELT
jgi:hypothetical protein